MQQATTNKCFVCVRCRFLSWISRWLLDHRGAEHSRLTLALLVSGQVTIAFYIMSTWAGLWVSLLYQLPSLSIRIFRSGRPSLSPLSQLQSLVDGSVLQQYCIQVWGLNQECAGQKYVLLNMTVEFIESNKLLKLGLVRASYHDNCEKITMTTLDPTALHRSLR